MNLRQFAKVDETTTSNTIISALSVKPNVNSDNYESAPPNYHDICPNGAIDVDGPALLASVQEVLETAVTIHAPTNDTTTTSDDKTSEEIATSSLKDLSFYDTCLRVGAHLALLGRCYVPLIHIMYQWFIIDPREQDIEDKFEEPMEENIARQRRFWAQTFLYLVANVPAVFHDSEDTRVETGKKLSYIMINMLLLLTFSGLFGLAHDFFSA